MALSFSLVIAANCGASIAPPSPDEVLVWNLAEYETGTGAQWQTVSFPTLPGAVYTLASSHDLENWEALQSLYAVGTELELALFELTPSPTESTGGSGEIPEETIPITNVNFRLRPLTGDNGTLVTWTPLEEGSPETKHTQILTLNLAPEWESLPFYINDFDPFLFMLGAHLGSPVDPVTVVPTQLPAASPDAEVFQRLQAEIAGIQQTVVTNHATWENAPVPPPPHPDAKCFYRLERTLPDSDGDGLPDYLEIHAGLTDPFNSDTDGDGTPDGQDRDSFPPGGSPGAVPPGTSFSYTITKEESRTSISGMGDAGNGYVSYPVDGSEYISEVLEPAIVFDSYGQAAAANVHFDQSGEEDGWRDETGNGRINLGQNSEGWYSAFHTEKRVTISSAPVSSPATIRRNYLHLREVPYEPDTIDVIGTVEEELLIPVGKVTSEPGKVVEATSPSFRSGKGFFTETMSEGHDEFLLPVEVKYVDRDAPNHTWETESAIKDLPPGQPLFSQPPMHFGDNKVNTGDLVSWEIKFPENMVSDIIFAWEAEGPEGLNPQKVAIFEGVGENKWKIEDPLDWRPGKYKIRCIIDSNGNQTTLELDQEIGVRSGEVMVVGWIDADALVLPNGSGVPAVSDQSALVALNRIVPVAGKSISQLLDNSRRGTFMSRVAFHGGSPWQMPLSPDVTRRYFNAFMISNSGNEAPPTDFTKEIGANKMKIVDSQALVDFLSNARNYRLANRFQVKFLVDEQGKIKDEPFTAPRWARAGLTTVHLAPEKWFDFFKEGTFDNIPAEEGPFHKSINKTGQELTFNTDDVYSAELPDSIAQYAHARIADSGNASGGFVSKKINGRDIPWIWSEVKYKAPLAQGTVTTSPNHETFPAIWVYFNGQLIEDLKDPIEGNDLENFIQLGAELNN